jgi:hypothetical protein
LALAISIIFDNLAGSGRVALKGSSFLLAEDVFLIEKKVLFIFKCNCIENKKNLKKLLVTQTGQR